MPDYDLIPQRGSITIEEAIAAGKRSIFRTGKIIMYSGWLPAIGLPYFGCSFWLFPICILGSIIISYVYVLWATPRWRIWAYSGVKDIHQLERSAEIEGLLRKQSPLEVYGILSFAQRDALIKLQERFSEDEPFEDDQHIPAESVLSFKPTSSLYDGGSPVIVISDAGIYTLSKGFYGWADIVDPRMAYKSFGSPLGDLSGMNTSLTYEDASFCYQCPGGYFEMSLSDFDTTPTQLDYLLYIHRSRYEQSAVFG